MEDYSEIYYTNPDEMMGASRPKQNYAMHRQLTVFEAEVRRADSLFSVDRLYRELRGIIPQNFTVNSLKALREVVKNAPPSPQKRASNIFFKTFYEYLEYLRRLAEIFKERIYTVLFEFYYDTSFIRLKDLHVKKGGLVKGQGQGLSPDLVMEVGELCRQLSFNIDGLEDTVNCWQELLGESDIDPNLFDENSAQSIRQHKDCKRFQDLLRLVPDVLNKSRMAVVLARAWWYKAEKIRRKLAGNPGSDSGMSSSSEVEAPSVASRPSRLTNRQKATNNNPMRQQPTTSRNKVKSLEDMDKERTSYVKKPAPVPEPGNQNKKSKTSNRQTGVKKDPNQEAIKEAEQPDNGQSFAERKPKPPNGKSPPKRGLNQKSRAAKAESKSDDLGPAEEEKNQEETGQSYQTSDPKMSKHTKSRPAVRNQIGGVQRGEGSQVNAADAEDAGEATEDNRGQIEENGANNLPALQSQQKGKKLRDQDTNKNQRSASPDYNEDDTMPSIHNNGNTKGRRKAPAQARPNNTKTGQGNYQGQPAQRRSKEAPASMRGTEDGMEALSLEPEQERNEQEPRDSGPLSWQEKKLEKLRQKLEELIEGKETQQAALKLLTAMKDNLAREIPKYRGSYRLKRRLQARVALLMEKAHGWKEETKSLDYQHQLLSEDLRLEMKLNGSFYRYNDVLKDRIGYLNEMVRSERIGIEELLGELSNLKDTTDQMLYYGIPFNPDFDEYEMEFGSLSGYAPGYGYRYVALGGSLRPYKAAQFLRDEELLLSRSLQSRYERSIWDALKWENVDSMSLMSPEDSFSYPSRARDREENADGAAGGYRSRKDQGRGYQGDDDLSSESDGGEDERSGNKQPQMYDLKRDEKQPPSFVPI